MKSIFNFFLFVFLFLGLDVISQNLAGFNYSFDLDSLNGFAKEVAEKQAFYDGFFGDEFKVYMYKAQREFINTKYKLDNSSRGYKEFEPPIILSSGCLNEDFEASLAGAITTTNGITGWNAYSGSNVNIGGSCSQAGCCVNSPTAITIINAPTGWPIAGNSNLCGCANFTSYPIVYSVFGNTPNAGGGYGNSFIKINDCVSNYGSHRLTKSFVVTSANALFQYAYFPFFNTGHACCDASGFRAIVRNVTTGSLIPCMQYTASGEAGNSCSTSTCSSIFLPCSSTSTVNVWHPWKIISLDLSSYISNTVTLEFSVFDCTGGGHAGTILFDAQCSPAGSGVPGFFGTPEIVSSCGSPSLTLQALPGYCSYLWAGPDPLVNGATAQLVTTTVTGNYTVTMNPFNSCASTVKVFTATFTPLPNLNANTISQLSCTSSSNSASVNLTSGTPGYSVTWSPLATVSSTSATSFSVTNLAPGINTISVIDAAGCINSTTISVNSAPPVPSLSISATSGTVIGCVPSSIPLVAVNTSTLTNLTFTWQPGNLTANAINVSSPGVYTVTSQDTSAGSCIVSQTVAVSQNTFVPTVTVTPPAATLTCNGSLVTFTGVCVPTLNMQGQWFGPEGSPIGALTNSPFLLGTGGIGVYSLTVCYNANGCTVTQTVSVTANTVVPTMTVNALNGYTLTCNNTFLQMNITASAGPVPKTYWWTNLSTSVTTSPATGGYTINTPGNYMAEYMDGNGCKVSQNIYIAIDTIRPAPNVISNLASNSFTLNCSNPALTATALSSPLLPLSNYSFTIPPNLTITTNTLSINTTSVTSNPTTFTVLAEGYNGCVGRRKFFVYEDLITPVYSIVFTPTAITCSNPQIALSPNYLSGPNGPTNFTFTSPAPTTTSNASGALFGIPGTYTMNYQYVSNGCPGTATTNILSNTVPPSTVAVPPTVIPCGSNTATLTAGTSIQPNYYTYVWDPPTGAGLSCASCYSTAANKPGLYEVLITNTVNGCSALNEISVGSGTLSVGFISYPTQGFVPLNVGFTNTSSVATVSTGTVITSWNYGNGISTTYTNISSLGSPNGGSIYQAAGNYTVLLIVQQTVGTSSCVGTQTAVITIELNSDLIVPNIFTPNNDGVNDAFTVQSTNLSTIACIIYDRWGVKMYDVTSLNGKISWDGKTIGGKDAADGTYFFLIKADGKDGQKFEKNGTVNLFR